MAHEERPQVDRRSPPREVDEDVAVARRDDADGQLLGEQPKRSRRAPAEGHVRQLLLLEPVLAPPQHDVAPLVVLGAQPQVLAVVQDGVQEHQPLDQAPPSGAGFRLRLSGSPMAA